MFAMVKIMVCTVLLCAASANAVRRKVAAAPSSPRLSSGLSVASDLIRQRAIELAVDFERAHGLRAGSSLCSGTTVCTKLVSDAIRCVLEFVDGMPPQFHFLEIFCGSARCTAAVNSIPAYKAHGIDKVSGRDYDDITTVVGFFDISLHVLCVFAWGSVWFSPQCSTWGSMASHHIKRSGEYPWGDTSRADVVEANYTALLLWEGQGSGRRVMCMCQCVCVC